MNIKYTMIAMLIVAIIILHLYLFSKLIKSDLPMWLKMLLFMR